MSGNKLLKSKVARVLQLAEDGATPCQIRNLAGTNLRTVQGILADPTAAWDRALTDEDANLPLKCDELDEPVRCCGCGAAIYLTPCVACQCRGLAPATRDIAARASEERVATGYDDAALARSGIRVIDTGGLMGAWRDIAMAG